MRRKLLGPGHRAVAESRDKLADVLRNEGKLAEAKILMDGTSNRAAETK